MLTRPYAVVPTDAVCDERLLPGDLRILAYLSLLAEPGNWVTVSLFQLRTECRCGGESVFRRLNRLIDAGWLEKRGAGKGGRAVKNSYRMIMPVAAAEGGDA